MTEHGPLPEQALWPLLAGLIEALQAIHACGVVHRDLKPANVLLATDGPRVIDFGISRATDGTSLTAAGVVFGTPGYMSPEQAEGRGAGPESDVFALACVVAYGAAGMGPFGTGTAAAVLYRVVHAEPVLDRIPPRLRDMLAACLAKNPADRPTLRALAGRLPEPGLHRPLGGGVLAVASGRRDRRVPGPAGAGNAQRQAAGRRVLLGQRRASGGRRRVTLVRPRRHQSRRRRGGKTRTRAAVRAGEPAGILRRAVLATTRFPRVTGARCRRRRTRRPAGIRRRDAARRRYPQPYRAGRRAAVAAGQLPASMVTAIRLMYAGAAYSLVWVIGIIAISASIVKQPPGLRLRRRSGPVRGGCLRRPVRHHAGRAVARHCARLPPRAEGGPHGGHGAVRGATRSGVFSALASGPAGLGPAKLVTVIGWLIALAAVLALWRRSSSAFFFERTSRNR